jgi:signal transduction histidine kinase
LPAIYIDEFRLSQAFQNIINNAFESMTNKGRLTVAVKEIKNEKQIQFLFTDTGSGIPAEDLPLIFQSFYSSKSKGFGLGLALAKEIIKFHHGKISVTSVVRHGTTFKVVIPTLS